MNLIRSACPVLSRQLWFQFLAFAVCCLGSLGFSEAIQAEDTVEFLSGTKLSGTMLEIRAKQREFDFQSEFGGRQIKRTYGYEKVHAVTFRGKRFVLTPLSTAPSDGENEGGIRSAAEVMKFIESVGGVEPDWLASTPMNHPPTLDLDWPLKAPGKWNESKNVGQYIWGRVNPNVSRWKPGIKLVHECLKRHAGNPELIRRDQEKLGEMYFTLLQDYPRAAYWLRKAQPVARKQTGVHLAECYFRLGCKPLAMKLLGQGALNLSAIKLFGEMGELDRAIALTDIYAKTSFFNEAYLHAGDALRNAGELDRAMEYYQKVLDRDQARNKEYLKRYRGLASGAIRAIKLFDQVDLTRVSDGTYQAASMGYNADVHVQVKVANQRIESVKVTKHREKQFYAALTDTPKQIIDTQSVRDIDGTSGATITSQAIIHAAAAAIANGAP